MGKIVVLSDLRKEYIFLFLVCVFALCLFGCSKSESKSYLELLQEQGITDNSQHHWQNGGSESVQISPNGILISEVEDKYDKTLYQIENGKYKKIAGQAYDFFEFEGRVYYYNDENKLYCYNIKTEDTAVVFSSSTDILWIGLYNKNILCARKDGVYSEVLELYALDGKRIKTYFEKQQNFGQIVRIDRFVVFLEDLKAQVYDLESGESHDLICEEGLSDSFMVSDQENLYISAGRYVIEGDYNTSKVASKWNGLWKISLSDMKMDKWGLTKVSDHSYSKFYCVENKLYDEKFTLLK